MRRSALSARQRKVLAGGMSLLPLMKLRLASAGRLVDIGRLEELKAHGPTPMAASRSARS